MTEGEALARALGEVETAIRANDIPGAVDRAEAALDAGLEHPLLLNLRAHRREQAGRLGEALADLDRAQALAPADPAIANARGLCLARAGRMAEAAAAFDLAVRAAPGFAPGHYNRGWASEAVGDLGAAGEAYRRAFELAPDHAEAAAGVSFLAARRGDADEARAFAARALALRPGLMKPILALANVEIGEGQFAAAEDRLRRALEAPATQAAPQERAMALGLVADALDGQGRYDEAFAAYEAENGLTRSLNAAAFAAPGVQTTPQFLAWVTDYFAKAPPAAWRRRPGRPPPMPAAKHVFLIGFARSGTTLLETALAGAPEVVTLEEREALGEAVRAFMTSPAALDRLARAGDDELEPFRALYWRQVRDFGVEVEGRVFVDKNPFNTFKLPLIRTLFPEARILFSVRDPRDVVLSCFRRHFAMNPALFELLTLEGAARLYAATMRLYAVGCDRHGFAPHLVRYEDLVEDFAATTRAACDHIGVAWRADVADFAARGRARGIATPSATQVARGLYSGVGQWRRYERQLEPVAGILAPWVERFGYL